MAKKKTGYAGKCSVKSVSPKPGSRGSKTINFIATKAQAKELVRLIVRGAEQFGTIIIKGVRKRKQDGTHTVTVVSYKKVKTSTRSKKGTIDSNWIRPRQGTITTPL
jgi:hypothetical protein